MEQRILSDRDLWRLIAAGHLNLRGADLDARTDEPRQFLQQRRAGEVERRVDEWIASRKAR